MNLVNLITYFPKDNNVPFMKNSSYKNNFQDLLKLSLIYVFELTKSISLSIVYVQNRTYQCKGDRTTLN